jgi:hypothetical protein
VEIYIHLLDLTRLVIYGTAMFRLWVTIEICWHLKSIQKELGQIPDKDISNVMVQCRWYSIQ